MGTIKLHVHYFENGNLQLQEEKNIESKDIQYSVSLLTKKKNR
jgi:hypothetical protein